MTIIVNAQNKEWNKRTISYKEVVKLAGKRPENTYSVTYSSKRNTKSGVSYTSSGFLMEDQEIDAVKGMVFNVSLTGNA